MVDEKKGQRKHVSDHIRNGGCTGGKEELGTREMLARSCPGPQKRTNEHETAYVVPYLLAENARNRYMISFV